MLDHVGVRQAQDDRAGAVADRCQAGRRAEAVEAGDGPHDLGRDVEAADVVPGRGEPPGHRHAHVAEADETDAPGALGAHRPPPCCSRGDSPPAWGAPVPLPPWPPAPPGMGDSRPPSPPGCSRTPPARSPIASTTRLLIWSA